MTSGHRMFFPTANLCGMTAFRGYPGMEGLGIREFPFLRYIPDAVFPLPGADEDAAIGEGAQPGGEVGWH